MTDNEIIKALECCVHRTCNECIRQPIEYGRTERDCKMGLMKSALSLINRQQAEIERLQGWERLLKAESHAPIKAKARAEAIKEFAERLKAKFDQYGVEYTAYTIVDDVVKEMGVVPDD